MKKEYIRLGEYEHLGAMAHKRGLRDRDDPRWAILHYYTHSPIKVKKYENVCFISSIVHLIRVAELCIEIHTSNNNKKALKNCWHFSP